MLNRILSWLFGPDQTLTSHLYRVRESQTLAPHLYRALTGIEDRMLEELTPLDQAWLDRHQN